MYTQKILSLCILIIPLLVCSAIPTSAGSFLPEGRIIINDLDVPDTINAGETFTINITLQNSRFLRTQLKIQIDLLDGMLELLRKDIGTPQQIILRGKQTQTIECECLIRNGDIDWYKEEYNIQATLYQKRPLLGWMPLDLSTVQGIHVQSPISEKNKVHILRMTAPEQLTEEEFSFSTTLEVINEGSFDQTLWARIDLVEKPSVLPQLEQYNIITGLASQRKQLGQSQKVTLQPGERTILSIPCMLRQSEYNKQEFTIESLLFVTINGEHFQVDISTMQGIIHKQSFLQENSLYLITGVIIFLIILVLVMLIIRIVYPAYYIKRKKLQEEKNRIEKREL